jgi:hypothetical protein
VRGAKKFSLSRSFPLCRNLRLEKECRVRFFSPGSIYIHLAFGRSAPSGAHICASSSAVYKLLATYTLASRELIYVGTHTHTLLLFIKAMASVGTISAQKTLARAQLHIIITGWIGRISVCNACTYVQARRDHFIYVVIECVHARRDANPNAAPTITRDI